MSKAQIRFDTVQFPKMYSTKEGYLRGKATVTRVGVFDYHVRKELRHPDEVFKKDSLETLKMIPVTNDHPNEMMNANNASKYQVGYTGEHYDVNSNAVVVTLTITDKATIEQIKTGKHQVSMGYICDTLEEKGKFDGVDYTHKQVGIVYNHLAIVKEGRAGSNIRLRFDSALVSEEEIKNIITEENNMSDEKNTEQLQLKYDALESKFDSSKKDAELLKIKNEHLQVRLDAMEKAYNLSSKEIEELKAVRTDAMVAEQAKKTLRALIFAAPVLGNPIAWVSHAVRDIQINGINNKLAKERKDAIDFTGKSDEAVEESFNAHFDVYNAGNLQNKIDCKDLVKGLYSHYDSSSRNMSIGEKIIMHEAQQNAKKKTA
jgi:hypothetical protein